MLHPYLARVSEAAAADPQPPFRSLTPAAARLRAAGMRRGGVADDPRVRIRDTEIAGVRVREYTRRGEEPLATAVYAHSGGWVLGDLDGPDAMLRALTVASGVRYISVDYRLAPEDPHPAALDDVEAVLQAVADRPVVLHGDSAGGNLAAVLAARHPELVTLQVLVYPVVDHDFTRASYRESLPPGFLEGEDMVWFWDQYLPDPAARHAADASPLHFVSPSAPPAVIVTAGFDPLRDEGIAYAEALAGVGVAVTHVHVPECAHGFISMVGALEPADRTVGEIARLIREHVTVTG